MNKFATITLSREFTYQRVKFYSVTFEDDVSEADKFFEKMEQFAAEEDSSRFIALFEEIGNHRGAKERYFRKENAFDAFPPKNKEIKELKLDAFEPIDNWRLYCLRLSDTIVVLFNGGIKTTDKALECPQVSPFFRQAEKLTKMIDEAIKEGDIRILSDELKIKPKFELML